jgi:hypothetical protein
VLDDAKGDRDTETRRGMRAVSIDQATDKDTAPK